MDPRQLRTQTIQTVRSLGVNIPPTLPLLDAGLKMRCPEDATCRLLAMNAVAASAYGFDRAKAIAWLNKEELINSLSLKEKRFLFGDANSCDCFKLQVEGMWAIAWALGITNELNFAKDCDSRFVGMLPNLKQSESCGAFRRNIRLRPVEQVMASCDVAYCLHWFVRQANLGGNNSMSNLKSYIIVERRRALEWLLSEDGWDEVSLDT